jgi:hypothetical protein
MIHRGGCHCGALTLEYETAIPVENWRPRACACSFCRKHGARNESDPAGALRIHAREAAMARYRFGLHTADFLVCRACGCYVACVISDGTRWFGSLNLRMLDTPVDAPVDAPDTVHDWSHETADQRRARRYARWTPTEID